MDLPFFVLSREEVNSVTMIVNNQVYFVKNNGDIPQGKSVYSEIFRQKLMEKFRIETAAHKPPRIVKGNSVSEIDNKLP